MSGLRDELAALVACAFDCETADPDGAHRAVPVEHLTAILDRFPQEAEGEALRFERVLYEHRDGALTCYDHTSTHQDSEGNWRSQWCCLCGAHALTISWREHVSAALAASPEEQDRG